MDTVTESLYDLIAEACALLEHVQRFGRHDAEARTQLELLRCELVALAGAGVGADCAHDACEVTEQINAFLASVRAAERLTAKAS